MLLASGPAAAQSSVSQSVFGADPNLADGALALRLGDSEEGIRLTLEGLRAPAGAAHSIRTRSSAHNNLCAGYVMSGKFREALEHCNEALRLKSNNWHAYSNRAVLHVLTGRLSKAAEDIEQAKRINPDAKRLREAEEFLNARRAARDQTVKQS
jgi:Flp pilus assembly protein TadD